MTVSMMTIMARTTTATGEMTASSIIRTTPMVSAATMETTSAMKEERASTAFVAEAAPVWAAADGSREAVAAGGEQGAGRCCLLTSSISGLGPPGAARPLH